MWARDSNVVCHLNYWLCLLKRNLNITKNEVIQIFVRTQLREAVCRAGLFSCLVQAGLEYFAVCFL